MKIFFASDHAGFELKNILLAFVRDELGYEVEDCGAFDYDEADDYPVFVKVAAEKIAENPDSARAIILGGSGQGEAIVANRFKGVRAVVYYGDVVQQQTDAAGNQLSILKSTREHNDANALSLGARFLDEESAKEAVRIWLETSFSGDERHVRRITQIDS